MRLIFVKLTSKLQKFLGKHGIRVEQIATIQNLRFRSWQLDSIQFGISRPFFVPFPLLKPLTYIQRVGSPQSGSPCLRNTSKEMKGE